ncbi:MAG TPA: TIGR00296 family protein [Nitrososphaera sp.]|nr:TIGR00296 family protein [Nitrososphaera sp.]
MLHGTYAVISDTQGAVLVELAREAVEEYLSRSIVLEPQAGIEIHAGVFVTLNYLTSNREEHLRGCIGFPVPEKQLSKSVVEAAIAAATQDPRFPPIDLAELPNIIFEVSVLTPPEQIRINPAGYANEIKIGRDGLIFRWKYGSGLLLPQVPSELNWDVEEFLANICYKAGAPPDAWLDPSTKLFRFQAIVFKEVAPRGQVVRLKR